MPRENEISPTEQVLCTTLLRVVNRPVLHVVVLSSPAEELAGEAVDGSELPGPEEGRPSERNDVWRPETNTDNIVLKVSRAKLFNM